jgi:3-isopropylmalate/(R)-2-methylmalate dehydratase large subunit
MVDRITIANMSAETGATTCTITASETADEFLRSVTGKKGINFAPDPDAEYADTIAIDVSKLSPVVAAPPSPSNAVPVDILSEVKVDQVFLGSCTNGTIDDFRRFVEVLGENKFNSSTRVIAIPGSNEDYVLAEKEGLLKRIAEAGGAVSTSCCGPCVGGHYGVLAKDEVCLSTANRNFPGRMGHTESEVFLGSPAIAAATAVRGYITHPGEVAG